MNNRPVQVDLAPFWTAFDQIQQEQRRLPEYTVAAEFWTSFDQKLRSSTALVGQVRKDMELNTQWSNPGDGKAASTAFYERIDAGLQSVNGWLDLDTAGTQQEFTTLVSLLDSHSRTVADHRTWLLEQEKVVDRRIAGRSVVNTTAKISDQDRTLTMVEPDTSAAISTMIADTTGKLNELRLQFDKVRTKLDALPHTQKWLGPTTLLTGQEPGQNPMPGGPAPTGPTAPTPANQPGGPAGPGSPTTPGPTDVPAPTGPGSTPAPTAADQPISSPPTPGDPGPAANPADLSAPLPSRDPVLAGNPNLATAPLPGLDPIGSKPLSSLPGPGAAIPPLPPVGIPFGSTPVGRAPGSDGVVPFSPSRPGQGPGDVRGATEAATPVRTGGVTPEPVLSRGTAPTAPGNVAGAGFYPPMMPPMFPPGGGQGSGIRPGEADSAGGLVSRNGGRDSWRAGVLPQLQGRSGDRRDEQRDPPPAYPPTDEVLDEELWRVPGDF